MRKLGLLLFLVSFGLTTGCSADNSNHDLLNVQKEIDQSNLAFHIPIIDGYEVSYVQHAYPPKDPQGNAIGSGQEVLVTYTNHKGQLNKLTAEQKVNNDREILYGPYQGYTLIEITYSNMTGDLDKSELVEMDGEQVQRLAVGEHTFLLFNSGHGSITMNYNNLDEAAVSRLTKTIIEEVK